MSTRQNRILLMIITAVSMLATSGCETTPAKNTFQKMYGGSNSEGARSIQQTSDGGYIVAGYSDVTDNGMDDFYIIKLDSNGNVIWENTYGGSGIDFANSIQQTDDGGYIVAGWSSSPDISGVTNHGGADAYTIKLDSTGKVEWQKMFGGSNDDYANSIRQTSDGGYIVAGYSSSTDISGVINHGDGDGYLIKLDSDGNVLWQNMYGGSGIDKYDNYDGQDLFHSVQQTYDGGYIVAGSSQSADISGVANQGRDDYYIIKLDGDGNVLWQNMYGGALSDFAISIQQTYDGDYIIAGSFQMDTDISQCYIIKLDGDGNVLWQNIFGGSDWDVPTSIQQTNDEGYIVAGYSTSTDIKNVTNHGGDDCYIIKLDSAGNIEWQKMYGGSKTEAYWHPYSFPQGETVWLYESDPGDDRAFSIQQTGDGGYIVAGESKSVDISGVTNNSSVCRSDVYILKFDKDGNL